MGDFLRGLSVVACLIILNLSVFDILEAKTAFRAFVVALSIASLTLFIPDGKA